jgi:hypothetical protein
MYVMLYCRTRRYPQRQAPRSCKDRAAKPRQLLGDHGPTLSPGLGSINLSVASWPCFNEYLPTNLEVTVAGTIEEWATKAKGLRGGIAKYDLCIEW